MKHGIGWTVFLFVFSGLSPLNAEQMVVVGDFVNIRKLPDRSAAVIGQYHRGDFLSVTGHSEKPAREIGGIPFPYYWYKVEIPGSGGMTTGWVYGAYLGKMNDSGDMFPTLSFEGRLSGRLRSYLSPVVQKPDVAPEYPDISFPVISISKEQSEGNREYFIILSESQFRFLNPSMWKRSGSVDSLFFTKSDVIFSQSITGWNSKSDGSIIMYVSKQEEGRDRYFTLNIFLDHNEGIARAKAIIQCKKVTEDGICRD